MVNLHEKVLFLLAIFDCLQYHCMHANVQLSTVALHTSRLSLGTQQTSTYIPSATVGTHRLTITPKIVDNGSTSVIGAQASSMSSGNCSESLGMTNKDKIPDNNITASSNWNSTLLASHARLQNSKSWVANSSDKQPWIRVKLKERMNITAIAIQGFPGSGFVSSFYISYGDNSENDLLNYTTHGGIVKVFQGNTNDNGTERVLVSPLVTALYIRLHPINCSGLCALRMELYGCDLGLPGKPFSLRKISVSSSTINVAWDPPTKIGGGIKGYIVKWQKVNDTSGLKEEVVPLSSSISAALSVTPYTLYDIHVRAFTDKGNGPWSLPVRVRSSESVPSAAPSNFNLSSSSSLSLTASWDAIPVKQQQGVLLGYLVAYKKEGAGSEQNENLLPHKLSYTMTGLEFVLYSVRVAGYTAVGTGPFAAALTIKPNEGAPSAVRNLRLDVRSPTSIVVFWDAPSSLNGVLRRYVVTYGMERGKLNERRSSPTDTSYTLTSLEEFTDYYVQVFAETSISGSLSKVVQDRTFEAAPSAPPIIIKEETVPEDAHTITVKWNSISKKHQNGDILGYTVAYKVHGQPTQLSFNTTDRFATINGLKPYTRYCIKVLGFNRKGSSPWSPCIEVTTLQSGPSHPQDVVVKVISSTAINVKWKEPAHPNGVIKAYIIAYRKKQDHHFADRTVTGNTFELTLTDLMKFTLYYIKVRGKTTEIGNASKVLNATTSEDRPGPPTEFSGRVKSGKVIFLSWKEPLSANGIIRAYNIRVYETKTGREVYRTVLEKENGDQSLQVSNLKPYTNFTFTIQAKTIELGEMANFTAKTFEGEPSKPADVQAKLDEGGINVYWEEPVDHNGVIIKYNVYCNGRRAYNSFFETDVRLVELEPSRYTTITKEKLKPGTEYTIYVTASTVVGEGEQSDPIIVNTAAKAPPPPSPPQVLDGSDSTATTITISLTTSSDINGRVVVHEVIVERVGKVSKRSTSSLPEYILGYDQAMAKKDRYYIAARFEGDKEQVPRRFVLGDGKTYGTYLNAPLQPLTKYKVYVRAATDVNGKWVYGEPGEPAEVTLPPTDDCQGVGTHGRGCVHGRYAPATTAKRSTVHEYSDVSVSWMTAVFVEGALLIMAIAAIVILVMKGPLKKNRQDTKDKVSDEIAELRIPLEIRQNNSLLNSEQNVAKHIKLSDEDKDERIDYEVVQPCRAECGYAMLSQLTQTPGETFYTSLTPVCHQANSGVGASNESPIYVNQAPTPCT